MAGSDPYAILGVARDATPDQIKSAYRKLARQYHPDVNPNDPSAEEKFKEVSTAYAILSDPEKKARYDQYGVTDDQAGPSGNAGDFFGGAGGFGDLFEAFFGGAGGQQSRRAGTIRDGDDIRAEAVVSLREVLDGAEKKVSYRRSVVCDTCGGMGTADRSTPPRCNECNGRGVVTAVKQTFIGSIRTQTACPKCRGEGFTVPNPCGSCHGQGVVPKTEELFVSVPIGVESGQTLRVSGRGSEGIRGGTPGDLYVILHVADDARFEREGRNLATQAEISFAQAALGDTIVIDGLAGQLEINIEPGTQPGDTFRIKGEGIPRLGGGSRGDLFVQLNLVVPKKISEAEAALLREFAELRGETVPKGAGKGGFFEKIFKKR